MRGGGVALVVLDSALPGGSSLRLLDEIRAAGFTGPVLFLAGSDAGAPVPPEAARSGTVVLRGLVTVGRLYQCVSDALHAQGAQSSATLPEILAGVPQEESGMDSFSCGRAGEDNNFGGFIGTSGVMQALYEQIQNAARSAAAVFITGESGTGKEVCAQAIHKNSVRMGGAFVPLNCAAIPHDLLESEIFGHVRGAFTGAIADRDGAATQADGGTLFLDEIGDMDPNMQTKLLRFLQDGTFQRVGGNRLERVDVRIICATNRDPAAEVKAGRFREDLFYRLHVLPIIMPPLRARGEDVVDIAQLLLLRYAAEEKKRFRGFEAEAEALLRSYDWPGNIRQLQNAIRQTVVMHDGIIVSARMLPPDLVRGVPPAVRSLGELDGSARRVGGDQKQILPLHVVERRAIEAAIKACGGNVPRAAALLEVSPSTLYRKKTLWEEGGATPAGGQAPAAREWGAEEG